MGPAVLVAILATPALAQSDQLSPPVSGWIGGLLQIQQSNAGIARQMSETEARAADLLLGELAKGIADPATKALIEALANNALVLASLLLSPLPSPDARAETLVQLVEDNVSITDTVEEILSKAPAEETLRAAVADYGTLQLQTRDLATALLQGWERYASLAAEAEVDGLIAPGSFDPKQRQWALQHPTLPNGPAEQTTEPQLASETPPPEEPAVLEEPAPLNEAAPLENMVASVPVDPAPAPATSATDAPSTSGPQWTTGRDQDGQLVAISANMDPETLHRIATLTIGCHPNGTLRYTFQSASADDIYIVMIDDVTPVEVQGRSNVIAGSQALRMSDALRLGYEAAAEAGQPFVRVALAEAPNEPALFPSAGYLPTRGQVLDACLPWTPPADLAAQEAAVENEQGEPLEAKKSTEAEAERDDDVAPIPYPRPKDRIPVNLMTSQ